MTGRRGERRWPAYGAAAWAFVFAVRGVYWALGGTIGLGTLSDGIQEAADAGDPMLRVALWVAVVLLWAGTLLALAMVRPWGRVVPHRVPRLAGRRIPGFVWWVPAAGAGALLAMHGLAYVSLLFLADPSTAEVRWYGSLWGPWFVLGGVLYLWAAEDHRRRTSPGARSLLVLLAAATFGVAAAWGPVLVSWVANA